MRVTELTGLRGKKGWQAVIGKLERDAPRFPVVSLIPDRFPDAVCEPFVRDETGGWMTGRWVGHLHFAGVACTIEPRIGWERFQSLLAGAAGMTYVGRTLGGLTKPDDTPRNLLALLWCLALERGRRLHHGPVKGYVERYDPRSPTLRGRLDLPRQLCNTSLGQAHRLACRYRELSYDIPVNRGILMVTARLKRAGLYPFHPDGPERISHREELEGWRQRLLDMGARQPAAFPQETVTWNRTNGGYRKAHELGRLLARSRGGALAADAGGDALLFDSAEVWELFLYQCLKRALRNRFPGWRLHSPRLDGRQTDFLFEYGTIRRHGLCPDFILYDDNHDPVAVLDAKYRYFHRYPRDDEIQQMALYACRYGRRDPLPAILIYPRCGDFNPEQGSDKGRLLLPEKTPLHWWLIELDPPADPVTGVIGQLRERLETLF